MAKRATINDVAHLAGVSIMTVSRVMREHPHVRPETRERVQKAIKTLNYHPSFSARALSKSATGKLGLLISHQKSFDDIYSHIATGIENECRRHNYSLVMFTNPIQLEHLPPVIAQRKVDGVIIGGSGITYDLLNKFKLLGLPLVLIDYYANEETLTYILPDDFEGAYQAIKYLTSLGHRNIAFIFYGKNFSMKKRLQGYKLALCEAGVNVDDSLIFQLSNAESDSYGVAEKIFNSTPKPTAIFCGDDLLAKNLLRIFKEKQIDVPKQMSLIGFGDLEVSTMTRPPLTTVHVDKQLMGKIAVHRLVEMFRYKDMQATKTLLPTQLIIRDSCMSLN